MVPRMLRPSWWRSRTAAERLADALEAEDEDAARAVIDAHVDAERSRMTAPRRTAASHERIGPA